MKRKERRGAPRYKVKLPLKLSDQLDIDAEGMSEAEMVNLSKSGAYCLVVKKIPLWTKLKLSIILPLSDNGGDEPYKLVQCEAVVVRVDPPEKKKGVYGIALFFTRISPQDAENISRYLSSLK